MRRGPAPKPISIKRMEGNPGHQCLTKMEALEPKLKLDVPTPPDYLDAEAKNQWNYLAPLLLEMRVVTRLDQRAFAQLCVTMSEGIQLARQILKARRAGKSGEVKSLRRERDITFTQERRLWQEFGLTPSARTRLHAIAKTKGEEVQWGNYGT